MPTIRPTDEDRELAESANALLPEKLWIASHTMARWRSGRWLKGRRHEAGLLPRRRQGFGGPVLYTEEAHRTAACLATVMAEVKAAHLRPRLEEVVLVCFLRGHEFKLSGLRWAYLQVLDRLREDMERLVDSSLGDSSDERTIANRVGHEISRRSGAQGRRMRERLKVTGGPPLPVVMVGLVGTLLGIRSLRPEPLLAFGWPGPVTKEDEALAEQLALDPLRRLFDEKDEQAASLAELLQAREDLLALKSAEDRLVEVARALVPDLPAEVEFGRMKEQSEEEAAAFGIPMMIVLRRDMEDNMPVGFGFDAFLRALTGGQAMEVPSIKDSTQT